ncbi:hypothetical protein ACP70R_022907 [Stipagrostis hirtigluma subsp. patula]
MAAMARNTLVLLVLAGVIVQLCSVVPPAAAAGRSLADLPAASQDPKPSSLTGGTFSGENYLVAGDKIVDEGPNPNGLTARKMMEDASAQDGFYMWP